MSDSRESMSDSEPPGELKKEDANEEAKAQKEVKKTRFQLISTELEASSRSKVK